MSVKRFRSKVDTWLVVVVVAALIAQAGVLAWMAIAAAPLAVIALALGTLTAVYLFIGLTLTRTWYEIDARELRIVCGLFHWTIPLDSIHSVGETRNPLSSPALSLDRLRIRYGKNRSILVSPDDKSRFLKALDTTLQKPSP